MKGYFDSWLQYDVNSLSQAHGLLPRATTCFMMLHSAVVSVRTAALRLENRSDF